MTFLLNDNNHFMFVTFFTSPESVDNVAASSHNSLNGWVVCLFVNVMTSCYKQMFKDNERAIVEDRRQMRGRLGKSRSD